MLKFDIISFKEGFKKFFKFEVNAIGGYFIVEFFKLLL